MNSYITDSILGFIQGVTELLPVSSSGHLILVSKVMDVESSLMFVILLHGATLLAIMIAYRKIILDAIMQPKLWLPVITRLIIATIPVGVLGVVMSDLFERFDKAPLFIGANLLIWGVIMIIAEYFADKNRDPKASTELDIADVAKIPLWKVALIGVGQALSLLPGTSRSGITTLSGMATGLSKEKSLDFAFFAGIPAIGGAFAYKIYDFISEKADGAGVFTGSALVGTAVAFIFGYLFIEILRKIKGKKFFTFFGIYRIILGIIVITIYL